MIIPKQLGNFSKYVILFSNVAFTNCNILYETGLIKWKLVSTVDTDGLVL